MLLAWRCAKNPQYKCTTQPGCYRGQKSPQLLAPPLCTGIAAIDSDDPNQGLIQHRVGKVNRRQTGLGKRRVNFAFESQAGSHLCIVYDDGNLIVCIRYQHPAIDINY